MPTAAAEAASTASASKCDAAPRQMERAQINVGSAHCCQRPSSVTRLCKPPLAPSTPLGHPAPHISTAPTEMLQIVTLFVLSASLSIGAFRPKRRYYQERTQAVHISPMYLIYVCTKIPNIGTLANKVVLHLFYKKFKIIRH